MVEDHSSHSADSCNRYKNSQQRNKEPTPTSSTIHGPRKREGERERRRRRRERERERGTLPKKLGSFLSHSKVRIHELRYSVVSDEYTYVK